MVIHHMGGLLPSFVSAKNLTALKGGVLDLYSRIRTIV
jgi:hypothetical protein